MRTIVTADKNLPSMAATRLRFVMQDFLKMFLAALVCGLVFSVLAAGMVLLVTGNAEARMPGESNNPRVPEGDAQFINPIRGIESNPGVLTIGDGGDDETLPAIQSDWLVRVKGKSAEIRVMQDYRIPANATMTASFTTLLPAGASFRGLKVYTARDTFIGKIITSDALQRLDRVAIRDLLQRRQISVVLEETRVQAPAVPNLRPGELITVEYTYAVPVDTAHALASLSLLLNPVSPQMVASSDNAAINMQRPLPANISVWVEWIGQRPLRLLAADEGVSIDETREGIAGASWFSPDLDSGKRFTLIWENAK